MTAASVRTAPGRYGRASTGALAVETEVPTPHGVTNLGALEPGDQVFGAEGTIVRVLEVGEPTLEPECFVVEFATGERIVADEHQPWLIERRDVPISTPMPSRRSTLEIACTVAEFGPTACGVRVAPPVQLPARRLPIDPYLLGAWLGTGLADRPALIEARPELVRSLAERGVRIFTSGLPGQHWIALPGEARRGADLGTKLRVMDLLDQPHIPMAYLRASEGQRRELLAGILDAAGVVTDGGEVLVRPSTPATACGLHELLGSLGHRPRTRPNRGGLEVGFFTSQPVFSLPGLIDHQQARRRLSAGVRPRRVVTSVSPAGARTVRPLRVSGDDGLMLVGRSFIPVPVPRVGSLAVPGEVS